MRGRCRVERTVRVQVRHRTPDILERVENSNEFVELLARASRPLPRAVLLKTAQSVQGQFVEGDLKAASVACALRTSSGHIYTGVNMDLTCGIGFCAEHSAVARMLEARETRIEAIVAVWDNGHIFPPCGRCREMLLQVNAANLGTRVLLAPLEVRTLAELMPFRWQDYRGW